MSTGSPPPPEIPDHLLLEVIGRGSYGEVWLARNTVGAMRAVKIIRRAQFDSARPYEREFTGLQKYEPLSRSHEGLMDILHIGRNDAAGYFYYVMELADEVSAAAAGETEVANHSTGYVPRTLRTEIKSLGRLPAEDCLRHFISLAGALEHLHRHGLIHRDVKPSNIIFVAGVAKLADIGLVAEMSESRSFVGTEGFIPLEGPGTAQADVFSLGKVLYEAATGLDRLEFPSLPLGKGELTGQSAMIELNAVAMKACAPKAAERYQSAAQMMADLALMQSGRSVQDQHRAGQRLRLARRVSVLAGAAAVLAASGWIVQSWRAGLERKAFEQTSRALSRAEAAEAKTRDALYAQALALARAESVSPRPGRRFRALDAIRGVAPGHPDDLDLRNAVIAALALADFRETGQHYSPPDPGRVFAVCTDPSGRRLAVSEADGTTKIMRIGGSGEGPEAVESSWKNESAAVYMDGPFSDDGSLLAQRLADKTLFVRDVPSGEIKLRVPAEIVSAGSSFWGFAAGGAEFWVQQPERIIVYSLHGEPEVSIPLPKNVDTGGSHTRDGIYAFSARDLGYVVLVDLPNRRVAAVHEMGGQAFCCAISPCGQWLLAGAIDGTVRRMALREPRQPVDTLALHNGAVASISFHPDGDWFLTFSWDGTTGQVDSGSGTRMTAGALSGSIVAWSADGRRMAWKEGMSGDVVMCEAAGRKACHLITVPQYTRVDPVDEFSPLFTADGRHLMVTGKDGVRIYETDGGRLSSFAAIERVTFWGRSGSGRCLALSRAGLEEILFAGDGAAAAAPALERGKLIRQGRDRFGLAASRTGDTIAALMDFHAWVIRGSEPPVSVATSPDYRNINVSPDGSWLVIRGLGAELRRADGSGQATTLPLGGTPAFFGTPLRVIGAHQSEPAIECYDVASGTRVWRTPLDRALGYDTVISDDETMAAIVVSDRAVLIECATGRMLASLQHPSPQPLAHAAFSPDGGKFAVTTRNGTVQLWDLRLLRQELAALGLNW